MAKNKTDSEKEEQRAVKALVDVLEKKGVAVRLERLTRGHAFRVKSGNCYLSNQPTLFVDKSLPVSQQLSVVVDYLVDNRLEVAEPLLSDLPESVRRMLPAV